MRRALIGVDMGTTHIKAGAFSPTGRTLAVHTVPTPTERGPDGRVEYHPDAVWQSVCTCIQALTPEYDPIGVGVASMAEAGLIVDADGTAHHPAISWLDTRSRKQAQTLVERFGAERFLRSSGLYPSTKHSLGKILWLQEHVPGLLRPGAKWLNMAEYVAYRLTGEMASCPTLAVRTLAYDFARRERDTHLLSELGLPQDIFPDIVPEGQQVGSVSPVAASECGLLAGTPVALGGHDHPCALLAMQVTEPGQLFVSTGTAETLLATLDAPRLTAEAFATRISQGPQVVPGLFGLQVGISGSGGSVEWARRELFPGIGYAELEALVNQHGDRPSDLLFLPHLSGGGAPYPDPHSRGALIGMTAGTPRSALARALFEGPCFELRRVLSGLEQLTSARYEPIRITGGQVQNATWIQMKADILGRTFIVPDVTAATLLGAALLGGMGAGYFADPPEAAASLQLTERIIEPRPSLFEAYTKVYDAYLQLHPALKPLFSAWPDAV